MIGVLDSGVGGLSVWRELVKILPHERYLYVADSGFCPYGPRSKSYIIDRVVRISDFMIECGAKLIVVACNTATAAAIEYLRSRYSIPFVGMEPAIKPAALHSKSGVIGVLATAGTFRGDLYLKTLSRFAANVEVIEQIGTGLVEIVESGKFETGEAYDLLKKYLLPMLERGADHIVLGCTHYPFLVGAIKRIAGEKIEIVNPAPAIARRVENLLQEQAKEQMKKLDAGFYTTGENERLVPRMVESIMKEDGVIACEPVKCFRVEL